LTLGALAAQPQNTEVEITRKEGQNAADEVIASSTFQQRYTLRRSEGKSFSEATASRKYQ
jgi:hypothetical protein